MCYQYSCNKAMQDHEYKVTAEKNRGDATEQIAYDLLKQVFGEKFVFRGAKVKKEGRDVTDIDVLAACGNKAVVVQAKSKKLTEASRLGSGEQLRNDFQEAVQTAYHQALQSRKALIADGYEIITNEGDPIPINENLDDAYIICVTGDYYPALAVQLRSYLNRTDSDPHPVALSIFDLEVLCHYLGDPFDFLYYLRQRTSLFEKIVSTSELALLGFHIKAKLTSTLEADWILVEESFGQALDTDFLISRGFWPQTKGTGELSIEWRSEPSNDLLECVKRADYPGVTDAVFFLFDLEGERLNGLLASFRRLQRAASRQQRPVDMSIPIPGERRGISFVSYPSPSNSRGMEYICGHFEAFANARKYKDYADEWIALASIEGTPEPIDLVWYSKEPWATNSELDELVSVMLKPGRALNGKGQKLQRKPSRNQPCPCGSGRKFKRCHGR